MKRVKFSTFLIFLGFCSHALEGKSFGENLPSDAVKIQIGDMGVLPWIDFYDADPYYGFNLAVHGQPLNFTADMNIRPGYIKSWKWDRERNLYIFKIDTSLKYSNGTYVSAYDFEFALVKPLLTPLAGMDGAYLSQIKGVDKVKRGTAYSPALVEGIKVLDKETIEIMPFINKSRFLYSLNAEVPALAPMDSFKLDLFTFKNLPIGCGPYKVESLDSKRKMVLLKKVGSVVGPKIVEFYFGNTAVKNRVDVAFGPATRSFATTRKETLKGLHFNVGKTEFARGIEILEFNFRTKAAQSLVFRRAIALSQSKNSENNIPTDQLIPKGSFGFQNLKLYHDLEAAKILFTSLPDHIKKATHKIIVHGNRADQSTTKNYKFITDGLDAIGMKYKILVDGNTDFTEDRLDALFAVFGRVVDASPLVTFASYLPDPTKPNTPAADKTYEDLYRNAEQAETPIDRSKALAMLTNHIIENQIVVPLIERHDWFIYSSRINTVETTELTGYLDIANTVAK